MPFLLLLVLTLTYMQRTWPEPPFGPLGSVLLTLAGMVVLMVTADWVTRRLRKEFQRDPSKQSSLFRRFSSFRRCHLYALLAFYGAALYFLGWGWFGKEYLPSQWGSFPGAELILLAPFVVVLIFSWARFYDMERAGHLSFADDDDPPFPGRWSYVGLQARHNFLLVLPPLFLFLIQESVLAYRPDLKDDPVILPIFFACLVAGVFVGIPWILRIILGLTPLPEGAMRTRLLATARRLKFRFNNIMLWNTRNTVANAMVTGPLPFLRYVILSDRLLSELEPEEVEAVFGHEVGHVKHQHMLFYLGFVLISLVTLSGMIKVVEALFPVLTRWFKVLEDFSAVPMLLLLAGYFFVVFGFLSRRCERQADIFGCRAVSCPVFIDALEKVALLNGIHRERPGWLSSWQHSTIARRVDFLQRMNADPRVELIFQRRVRMVKWGLSLLLGATLATALSILMALEPGNVWAIFR